MWRAVWDETVSHIYEHTLSTCCFLVRRLTAHSSPMHRAPRATLRVAAEGGSVRGGQTAQEVCKVNGAIETLHVRVYNLNL